MDKEKLKRVLLLMFRQVKAPRCARKELKQRLFGVAEHSDDELPEEDESG
jgi:hypothetical protein